MLYVRQIADSSLLSLPFVFEEDTAEVVQKKDTVTSDSSQVSASSIWRDSIKTQQESTAVVTPVQSVREVSLPKAPQTTTSNKHQLIKPDSLPKDSTGLDLDSSQVSVKTQTKNNPISEILPQKRLAKDGVPKNTSGDLLFVLIVVMVGLLAFVRVYQRRLFTKFFQSFFSNYTLSELYRESKIYSTPVFWIGFANYVLNIGLTGYFFLYSYYDINYLFLWKITLGVFLYHVVKLIIYNISGAILEQKELFGMYNLYHFISFFVSGFIILALNIVYYYVFPSSNMFYIAFGVVAISLIFKFLRFFQLAIAHKIPLFHIFLYLCTLEILPLVVILKWFTRNFSQLI